MGSLLAGSIVDSNKNNGIFTMLKNMLKKNKFLFWVSVEIVCVTSEITIQMTFLFRKHGLEISLVLPAFCMFSVLLIFFPQTLF